VSGYFCMSCVKKNIRLKCVYNIKFGAVISLFLEILVEFCHISGFHIFIEPLTPIYRSLRFLPLFTKNQRLLRE